MVGARSDEEVGGAVTVGEVACGVDGGDVLGGEVGECRGGVCKECGVAGGVVHKDEKAVGAEGESVEREGFVDLGGSAWDAVAVGVVAAFE